MAISPLSSPVVLDGILSDEKLKELLALGTEYPELDFKATLDVSTKGGLVELAKDVGAMQVLGAYIIAGVDGTGKPTGKLDGADTRVFDEARLVPKLRKYLPEPLSLHTRVLELDGHTIVVICVDRHPSGFAIFRSVGQYMKNGEEIVKFRAGEVFWRDGTSSVRLTQPGFEEIVARRIAEAKGAWIEEQQQIRRGEQAELQAAYESRRAADAPLGAVNLDLETAVLTTAVLELARAKDTIAFQHMLLEAVARARVVIERDEIEAELGDVVDKLTCLAATLLVYDLDEWFERIVATLGQIFTFGFGDEDSKRFGFSTSIDPTERGPRVWLLVIQRVYGLGALAVRRGNWKAVRTLTLQLPDKVDDYYGNWLRYALTMSARAEHLSDQQGERTVEVSLLSLARETTDRLACLRPEGFAEGDDAIITSLAQFDVLSNVVAIDGSGIADGHVFYPNFARYRQARIQPVVDRLLSDDEMRKTLFERDDGHLAIALQAIGKSAHDEGIRYDGFESWGRTPVGVFIERHLPESQGSPF